jgi:DNA gyrase subunit B
MYIGSTGPRGVAHMLWEVASNSIDEHLAGHATHLDIQHRPDGSWVVQDNGRGIEPSRLPSIFTELHTGRPTLDGHLPHMHGGLFGAGVAVVCALSAWMTVTIQRDGAIWQQEYIEGKPAKALEQIGECANDDTGTTVAYLPDPTIFSESHGAFPTPAVLAPRVRELAALASGLTLTMQGIDFSTPHGLGARTQDRAGGPCPTMTVQANIDDIDIDVAVSWGKAKATSQLFVNYVNMTGTVHKLDLMLAASKAKGRHVAVSLLMLHPRFAGPTRQRLDDGEALRTLRKVIKTALVRFLSAHPHLRADP